MHDDASDVTQALAGLPNEPDVAAAYGRLYDRHAAVVLSLCRRAGLSLAEADDAMQETFIRAFRRLDQLDEPSGLRAWLYAIARNVCAESRRTSGRRRRHEAVAMKAATASTRLANNGTPQQAADAEHAEMLDRLGTALDELDDRERLAIHLFYLQDESAPAAMNVMNMSRSGFYKLLDRARQRLAQLMQSTKETSA